MLDLDNFYPRKYHLIYLYISDAPEEGAICEEWLKMLRKGALSVIGSGEILPLNKHGRNHEAFPSWVSSFTSNTTHLEAVPRAHNCWEMRSTGETVFIIDYLLPLNTYLTVHVGLKLLKLLPAARLHSENQ